MSKQNWEETVNLLLTCLNEWRSTQKTPESLKSLKKVLDKEQRERLQEQAISGRFDPCDPGDMVRVCSEILGIEKDSNQYQDFVLQVHFFVVTNASPPKVVDQTWQAVGRPPEAQPPTPSVHRTTMTRGLVSGNSVNPVATSTIPPPEPIGDGDVTKVKSAYEIELEEMVEEGKEIGDSLTSRLAAIQADNKKLETEVSEAKKAADGLEKSKKACLGELDTLCHVISGYQAHIEEEKNNRPAKEAEIAQVMDERRALEEQLAQAQDSLQMSQHELEKVKNEAHEVKAGLEEYENKIKEEYEAADQRLLAAKEKIAEAESIEARAKKVADEAQTRIDETEAKPSVQAIMLTTLSHIGLSTARTADVDAVIDDAGKYFAALDALILVRNALKKLNNDVRDKVINLNKKLDNETAKYNALKARFDKESPALAQEISRLEAGIAEMNGEIAGLNAKFGELTAERDSLKAKFEKEEPELRAETDSCREKMSEIEEYTSQLSAELSRKEEQCRTATKDADVRKKELDLQIELYQNTQRQTEVETEEKKRAIGELTATLEASKKNAEARISALTGELAAMVGDAEEQLRVVVQNSDELVRESFDRRVAVLDYVEKLKLQELDCLQKIFQTAIHENERHAADLAEQVEGIDRSRLNITTHSEREIRQAENELEAALEAIAKSAQCPKPAEPADTAEETVERR